ncbi:MAG TPA: hypothetical protein PLG59_02755, partial [bacterium]|nr:hypothetical protein [bacterium]
TESCRSQSCPIGALFDLLFDLPGESLDQFRQSKIAFLRGVRGMIDRRIESLESVRERKGKRARKVKVE